MNFGDYGRATATVSTVTPISSRWAWLNRFQGGANFSRNQSLLNNFFAGGMSPTFRNQIMFAGLQEGEIASESMAAAHTGLRYNPLGNFYVSLLGSALAYDFVAKGSEPADAQFIFGTGLTLAYDLPIGPIEFSVMMNDQGLGLRTYFNFGFPFRL
jgi:NTE family protein